MQYFRKAEEMCSLLTVGLGDRLARVLSSSGEDDGEEATGEVEGPEVAHVDDP